MPEEKEIDYNKLATAFSKSLEELFQLPDDDKRKRLIDITRVPLICQAIVGIQARLEAIEANINKGVWIILTTVIVGILALVIKLP